MPWLGLPPRSPRQLGARAANRLPRTPSRPSSRRSSTRPTMHSQLKGALLAPRPLQRSPRRRVRALPMLAPQLPTPTKATAPLSRGATPGWAFSRDHSGRWWSERRPGFRGAWLGWGSILDGPLAPARESSGHAAQAPCGCCLGGGERRLGGAGPCSASGLWHPGTGSRPPRSLAGDPGAIGRRRANGGR